MNKVEILSSNSEGSSLNVMKKQPSLMMSTLSSPNKSQIRRRMPIRTKKKSQVPNLEVLEDTKAKPNTPLKTAPSPTPVFSNRPFKFEKSEISKEEPFGCENIEDEPPKKSKY